jgi:hypothetical protein
MEDQELLKQEPRLLVWGFTNDEKSELDAALKEVQAPPAMTIEKSQGHMPLKEILFTDHRGDSELVNNEKVVLFYNIPQKGIAFLMSLFKQKGLPRPIFAMVTEHSIQWTFDKLLEHLIEEKEEMKRREATQKKGEPC